MDRNTLGKLFPFLFLYNTQAGIFTPKRSGHISARKMVEAQIKAVIMAGCDVIYDIVQRIVPIGQHGYHIEAEKTKTIFRTKRVLLATGAFTHKRNLLPKQYILDMETIGITVLLVNLSFLIT